MKNINGKLSKKEKIVLGIITLVIVVLLVGLIVSKNYRDFSRIELKENKNTIFTIGDLVVGDLKYTDSEKDVKEKMGKPTKEEEEVRNEYNYKKLYYKGLVLTLRENYNDYMLIGAEVTSSKYETSRGIKVGNGIINVINKYKVENKKGTYIYGNYSLGALSEPEITSNIYIGVRNRKEVAYVNRDTVIENTKTNVAKLNITYKHGKVTKITWSYDFE